MNSYWNATCDYYAQHSPITHPRDYAQLFDPLPHDMSSLVSIVQNLLVHDAWANHYNLTVSSVRRKELFLRTIPEMLAQILVLDPSPLTVPRPPEKRLVSICRDFAVLLVSILRHQGGPARLRIGFAGYFYGSGLRFWDHRIAEYWSEERKRWIMVDPQIDDVQRQVLGLKADTLTITRQTPFLPAGHVWRQCRAGKANPQEFGDGPDDVGMAPIRYALLHDFDALNKNELVGFDAWHNLIDKPENELNEADKEFLDKVAELTTEVDTQFDEMQTLYKRSAYGQAVESKLLSLMNRPIPEG
jgi:excinuclease ABC subunit A